MDFPHAVFKGILQGLTEFLPVSSTAHLIFTDTLVRMFGWHSRPPLPGEEEFYDILLHLGTLSAVLFYFRTELWRIAQTLMGRKRETAPGSDPLPLEKMPLYLVLSTVVTIGFVLLMLKGSGVVMAALHLTGPNVENLSDLSMAYPQLVAFHLMITGCLLFFTEVYSSRHPHGAQMLSGNALFIGLAQGCAAIFHGISRSGSTISAGLASGMDRLTATRYSFLLSIPTFLMAAVYEGLKLGKTGMMADLNWPAMLVGTLFSAVVGYLCVKYFVQFVARNSLKVFAIYCWVVGIGMYVFLSQAGAFGL